MSIKSKLEKLEGKMRKSNNYAEIIRKHANGDEGMLVHTVMALYTVSNPEHKGAIKARNYLEWINGYNRKVIDGAYSVINDLIDAGLATFIPTEFISDNRDVSNMTPPYPSLCTLDQILHYADSKDTQFWTDLE